MVGVGTAAAVVVAPFPERDSEKIPSNQPVRLSVPHPDPHYSYFGRSQLLMVLVELLLLRFFQIHGLFLLKTLLFCSFVCSFVRSFVRSFVWMSK